MTIHTIVIVLIFCIAEGGWVNIGECPVGESHIGELPATRNYLLAQLIKMNVQILLSIFQNDLPNLKCFSLTCYNGTRDLLMKFLFIWNYEIKIHSNTNIIFSIKTGAQLLNILRNIEKKL
jgi:hypothetical protein